MNNYTNNVIRYSVFIITIFFVCLHLLSVIFPALIVSIASQNENNLGLFELGANYFPLLIVNFIILPVGLLYYKNKLPRILQNSIKYIHTFEISRNTAAIAVSAILAIYVIVTVPDLTLDEESNWPDYEIFKEALKVWPYDDSSNPYISEQKDRHVRMFLLSASLIIFGNVKIIPFVASVLLVLITYFFTKEISKKRFPGVISIVVVLQSSTFLRYDTVAVYENIWALFYVLSLYVIYKKWYLSPVSYILSIFSKAFSATFLPMSLFFILREKITRKNKILLLFSYAIVVGISLFIWQSSKTIYSDVVSINFSEFWIGMTSFAYQLRFDVFLILFLLPLVVGLFIKSKQNLISADSIMFLILGALLAGPVVVMLTDFYYMLPYRYIPMIIFFAVGIGIMFSKKIN